jgi:hypothetical protein
MDYGSTPIYQVSIGRAALRVAPSTRKVGCSAGDTTFDVTNSDSGTLNWTATVVDGADWLSITSGSTGVNNGTITAHFTENTGDARTATIRVAIDGSTTTKDVTVVQGKKPGVGDVLSYFSTGLTGTDGDVYGLALRSLAEGTELHVAAGVKGTIYKFAVHDVADIRDGSEGTPSDFAQMTDPNVVIVYIKGLAMPPTYEGPYATQYVGVQDTAQSIVPVGASKATPVSFAGA